jgi:hypothetical protein
MIHWMTTARSSSAGSVSLTRRPRIAGVLPHVHRSMQHMAW